MFKSLSRHKKKHTGGSLVFFPQSSNSTIISYTYIYFSQYILNLVLQDPIYKVIVICTYILHPFIDNHWCIPFSEPKMITFLLMNIGNHTWTHWAIIFLFDIVVYCASIGNYGPPQVKCRLLISSFFDAMNFQHYSKRLEFNLQHSQKC